jgi:Protein of unknown function (DUF3891)
MLLRTDERGVLAIGQQSHAWICGQLARAWGNERFGAFDPYEEVCLGAEQHDIGMAAWDLAPTRNPSTGLPYSFVEMPLDQHMELWSAGPRLLLSQSRYAALLASIHGSRLYGLRDLDSTPEPDAGKIHAFLDRAREFQDELLLSLFGEVERGRGAVARNSDLVWTWDYMSLAVCLDWAPCTVADVPTADGAAGVTISASGALRLTVDPWPFAAPAVKVRCEGRRLSARGYASDEELAREFAGAAWETASFELVPAPRA